MPWKVLIADDEPKVRRGLVQLLSAHTARFQVVGEAADGEQALEFAAQGNPDLILVDIQMPFINGLELIARLVAEEGGADRRIIIISGHNEFEYARKAVGLGVFAYLLKPVEEEVLIPTLLRAAEDLSRVRTRESYLCRTQELAKKSRPVMLEALFRDALKGGGTAIDWRVTADFLGVNLENQPQLALVAPREHPGGGQPLWVGLALRGIAEEAFEGFDPVLLSWEEPGVLAVLANRAKGSGEADEDDWNRALNQLEVRARDLLGEVVSIDKVPVPGFPETLASVWEDLLVHRRETCPHGTLATLAMNILDRRFKEPELTLEDLSDELQVSAGHLSRVLKQSVGSTFVEALNKVRVRKATILLSDPAVKVYEVAERVGYSSHHYFCRAFRRVLGIAPSDYRRGTP